MTNKTPIGLQLFSVRGECKKDLPATLKSVADLGYVGAEPWGYQGTELEWLGWQAHDLRALFDDNGLACCGMHLSTGALLGDNLTRTIELNQILGNQFLIIAADKQRMSALDTIMELADILNTVADKLKAHAMFTGYHAHPFDFVTFNGETAWEILFNNTQSDVIMQMDVGNCLAGDGDPIAMLKKFPGRTKSIHLKDHGGEPGAVIGEGQVNWNEVFALCDTLHQPLWYVIEEGGQDGLGFEVSGRSLKALQAMGR